MKRAPGLRLAMLAPLLALGLTGCRAAGSGSMAAARPSVVRQESAFDLGEFIAQHNENARLIRSVEAKPTIAAAIGPPAEVQRAEFGGHLALERPRNFKLDVSHSMSTVADLGSNDERFWFWFSNKKDRSVYYCEYADLPSTNLAITYQPEWIVEAMGLQRITSDEAAQIRTRPGPVQGTTILNFPVARSGGQAHGRSMVVDDRTLRIKEFRVLSDDAKVVAQATVKSYREYPIAAKSADEDAENRSTLRNCTLPENIVLEWKLEQIALDVVLNGARVNQFDPSNRAKRFVQPVVRGYAPVNLAELSKPQDGDVSTTAVRETMPPPEPRSRTRRASPLQLGDDHSAATGTKAKKPDVGRPGHPLILPVLDLDVIDAPMPTAADPLARRTSSTIAASPNTSLER